MKILYNIYKNDGNGGLVDSTTPIASTADLSYNAGNLAAPSDTTFQLRAVDSATGLEEANTQARVRIILDASGNDVSARPNAPHALSARTTISGGCEVTWAYSPAGQGGPPVGFFVYLTPGPIQSYGQPAAMIAFQSGVVGYVSDLVSLADGQTYTVAVRSYNSAATEPNTTSVTILGVARGPSSIEGLSAGATIAR